MNEVDRILEQIRLCSEMEERLKFQLDALYKKKQGLYLALKEAEEEQELKEVTA